MSQMTRRAFTATGLTAAVAGCANALQAPGVVMKPVPPVLVSADRVVRVDVGLRPYRASGFRVEREMLGETAVVHNYGHGGGGITLSWGSAQLAVEEGFDPDVAEYGVLGAGALGMSTAMLLLERGAKVTLYAKALSPNTTSNIAGGQWWPASVYDSAAIAPGYMERHVAAARHSFRRFQLLTGPDYGISWEVNYVLSDRPVTNQPARAGHPMEEFAINVVDYAPGELPFTTAHARSFDTMMVDTPHYLRKLEEDIRERGGRIILREFLHAAEVAALDEAVVFNCTGLGAGKLFGDTEIHPVRGQLVILEPQAEIDYNIITGGSAYMFGRRDGIVLGGTFQHHNWSLEPSDTDTAAILAANRRLFAGGVGA